MGVGERIIELITYRSKAVIVSVLLVLLLVSAGGAGVEETTEMEMFDEEPNAVEKQSYVQEHFSLHDENTTQLIVVTRNESGNVLDRESLLESLYFQRALYENETVNSTLTSTQPIFGLENIVGTAIHRLAESETTTRDSSGDLPPLQTQIDTLESADSDEVEFVLEMILDPDAGVQDSSAGMGPTDAALDLLPADYTPGQTQASARLTVVTHETDGIVTSGPELSEGVRDSQVEIRNLADGTDRDEYMMTGLGLMLVEEEDSMADSFQLIGPLAILFVLVTLSIAYRDPLDLCFGLLGILLVLSTTFGAMGWLDYDFNLLMIAMPVLLIGLSIDYCIHVIMRYRENRVGNGVGWDADRTDGDRENKDGAFTEQSSEEASRGPKRGVRDSMSQGLAGIGPALTLVTITAVIGFLSIRTSGIPALTDFGIIVAMGLVSTLVVFGVFIPALKVELDEFLAARRYDRSAPAFGTTGRMRTTLQRIARTSAKRPFAILSIVLLVSTLGVAAGTHLETEFSVDDYVAEDAPSWTHELPGSLAPSEYEIGETREYLYANFQSPDQQVNVLVTGNITDPVTLEHIAAGERDIANRSVTFERPTGEAAVRGPVGSMQSLAASNESFATLYHSSDTTGDGVPDTNISVLFERFYAIAPDQADRVLHRTDDGYEAAQIEVFVDGQQSPTLIANEFDGIAEITAGSGGETEHSVTVTGDMIVNELVQRQLGTTLVEGLAVALVFVLVVLALAFRYTRGSATLGVVTLLPVLFGLSWILGSMYLLDIPFSFTTAIIGSIAIGLGVDYAIHMSERFSHELERLGNAEQALEESVVGTGGALLGSAVTTAGGFGVLAFALVPAMQQFGLILALTLVFAFFASVIALPSILLIWARYVGQTDSMSDGERSRLSQLLRS